MTAAAIAIAILLWSWAAWRNVHDVMVLAVGQGIWMIWAGIALSRTRLESPA